MMNKETPNYQRFLIQLYESARHPSMFSLLVHVCKMNDGAKDYADLEKNLLEVYKMASAEERAFLEKITGNE